MRGKFNTTVDVFKGPGTGSPGEYVGTFPCRLVREDAIETVGAGSPRIPFYLTIDAYSPAGSWTVGSFGLDPSLADQIAIPSGTSVRFWVLYTDEIVWHSPSYFRAYLVELPIPPDVGLGGVIVGGGAIYDFVVNIPSAGGLVASGSAHRMVAKHYTGKGGVTVNARGGVHFLKKVLGSGGVVGNSGGVYHHVFKLSGKGGVLTNSAATWHAKHDFRGFGGVMTNSSGIAAFVPGSGGPGNPLPVFDVFGVGGIGGVIRADMSSIGGMVSGTKVQVSGATVMTSCNGLWLVTVITSSQVQLNGSVANAAADGTPISNIEMLVLL